MASEIIYQEQTPIKGTVAAMAPPGNETGFYYIPVANLPWQTSWQQLKDHVRTVCPVERAEVHDMTGGHVVLKGRANFDAAFRLLNGGIFQGRALIADGRNTDQWVAVKKRLDSQGASPRLSRVSELVNQPMQYTSSTLSPIASSSNSWAVASPGPSSMLSPAMDSSPYYPACSPPYDYRSTTALYSTTDGSTAASMAATSSGVTYSSTSVNTDYYDAKYQASAYGSPYNRQQTGYYGSSYGDGAPLEGSLKGGDASQVCTQKRKIIVKQLPSRATEKQVSNMIHHEAGRAAKQVEHVKVPWKEDAERNRGFALITFATESLANKMIDKLSGYQYDGHVLKAMHTKEGVSENERSHPSRGGGSGHRHSKHSHREHRDEKDRKGKEKERHHKSSGSNENKTKSSSSSSSKSAVVIAHGSSSKY
ncbi:hypothetical protein F5Y18DRAFT_336302 [Xylariaceae sp. FL1019]|nr:hypothetical protein F5Y18DRAFT_336302 [Xylariaceae sp. FL1019]